ncbi:hypothetical protein L6R50_03055 [Myxococcota bacterium]|nr:hypothetical protein [Myxococcota bacterium]
MRGAKCDRALAVVCLLGLAAYAPLAWRAAGHCDEYNLLRHVTDFRFGDFAEPGRPGLLFFALVPLLWLGSPEAAFLGGRMVALGAATGTALLAGRLAERIGPRGAGAAAAAALLVGGNWLAHAVELRTDSFATPLALLALAALVDRPTGARRGAWVGLVFGVACCVSQKSVYPLAAFHAAAAAAWAARPAGTRRAALPGTLAFLGAADLVAAAVVVGWYGFMAAISGLGLEFVRRNLGAAAGTAFAEGGGLEARYGALKKAAHLGPLSYGLAALAAIPLMLRPPASPGSPASAAGLPPRARVAAVVAFPLAMLSTIAFHRGFFMYYVAHFEPFLAVVAGAGAAALARRSRAAGLLLGGVALALVAAIAVPWYGTYLAVHNGYQRAIMRAAHALYPEPVPYADGIGLVPGYPMVGFFNTALNRSWQREEDGGLVEEWRAAPALFYVYEYMSRERYLTPEERAFVRSHYLPYADNLLLHGGRVEVPAGGAAEADVEALAAGAYTVVFRAPFRGEATLDGTPVADGEVVELGRGVHRLAGRQAPGGEAAEVWVLHGRDRRPAVKATHWSGFPPLGRHRYQSYGRGADLATAPENRGLDRWLRERKAFWRRWLPG